jgi:hypothetical protein
MVTPHLLRAAEVNDSSGESKHKCIKGEVLFGFGLQMIFIYQLKTLNLAS